MNRTFAAMALLVLVAVAGLATGGVREVLRASAVGDGPVTAGGRVERCRACHDAPHEDPGGAHAADAAGCETCHLGNPLAFDRGRAHEGMEREPGALSTVQRTCGRTGCHPREAGRVLRSAMATGRGLVAVDRWVFGEIPGPDGLQEFADVLAAATPTPAEDHLRRLCLGCHLGTRGDNRDDAIRGTGSGCGACHATRAAPGQVRGHRPVDARVGDGQCRGCHSRSARISLTYAGAAEVKEGADPGPDRIALHDGRPGRRVAPDVHAAAGMACTDCHAHTDVMGDGTTPAHEEDAVAATCEACHGPFPAGAVVPWRDVAEPVTRDLLRARGVEIPPEARVPLLRNGVPAWNLSVASAQPGPATPFATLRRKLDGVPLPVRPTPDDPDHRLPGHRRLSCQSCHSAGIPWCADCHTGQDPAGRQWDFGRNEVGSGAWIETSGHFDFRAPALGVKGDRIVTAAPGMVMDLDARPAGGDERSVRLYGAFDPHSTGRRARDCASCHRSASTVGFGDGVLAWEGGESFRFTPWDPGPDGLARDRWTAPFPARPAVGTRRDLRSLDAAEQRRTLRVGLCTDCHPKAGDPIYRDFGKAWERWMGGASRCPFSSRRPS